MLFMENLYGLWPVLRASGPQNQETSSKGLKMLFTSFPEKLEVIFVSSDGLRIFDVWDGLSGP